MGWNCDLEHRSSKDVAIDLQNALKKLGYNNQTRITMKEDLLIRLCEDRFILVEFNRHNWDCEVKDTKNDKSFIEQVIIDFDKDKAYTSGIHYFKNFENIPIYECGDICGLCGETDITEIFPNALTQLVDLINFYKKADTWTCKYCGNMNREFDMQCPKCGAIRTEERG